MWRATTECFVDTTAGSHGESREILAFLPPMNQTLCGLVLCLATMLGAEAAGAQDRGPAGFETLDMVPGQQRVISAPGVTRIAVANPNVADVKVTGPGEVLITAVGDGTTELTIWRGAKVV